MDPFLGWSGTRLLCNLPPTFCCWAPQATEGQHWRFLRPETPQQTLWVQPHTCSATRTAVASTPTAAHCIGVGWQFLSPTWTARVPARRTHPSKPPSAVDLLHHLLSCSEGSSSHLPSSTSASAPPTAPCSGASFGPTAQCHKPHLAVCGWRSIVVPPPHLVLPWVHAHTFLHLPLHRS